MKILHVLLLVCLAFVSCKTESNVKADEVTKTVPTEQTTPTARVEPTASEPAPTAVEPNQLDQELTPSSTEVSTVTVSSLEDLVKNAKDNRTIYLEKGNYSLKKHLVYFMTKDESMIIDKNVTETRSLGGQLYFRGFSNFQVIAKKGATIISENPIAPAFYVAQSKDVKFSNFTIKKPVGGKVDMTAISSCSNVEIDRFKILGGGTFGMNLYNVTNIKLVNSTISQCNKGGMVISESKGIKILNSTFSENDCTVPVINFYGTSEGINLKNVTITNNTRDPQKAYQGSENIFAPGNNSVVLEGCTIENNQGFTKLGLGTRGRVVNSTIVGVGMQ